MTGAGLPFRFDHQGNCVVLLSTRWTETAGAKSIQHEDQDEAGLQAALILGADVEQADGRGILGRHTYHHTPLHLGQ